MCKAIAPHLPAGVFSREKSLSIFRGSVRRVVQNSATLRLTSWLLVGKAVLAVHTGMNMSPSRF